MESHASNSTYEEEEEEEEEEKDSEIGLTLLFEGALNFSIAKTPRASESNSSATAPPHSSTDRQNEPDAHWVMNSPCILPSEHNFSVLLVINCYIWNNRLSGITLQYS